MVLVWIGSLETVRFDGNVRKVGRNSVAQVRTILNALHLDHTLIDGSRGNFAFALLDVVVGPHDYYSNCPEHEDLQRKFWTATVGVNPDMPLYVFKVRAVYPLIAPVAVPSMHGMIARGLVRVLDFGQASQMHATLHGNPSEDIVTKMLRIPSAHALLVAVGHWDSFLLPSILRASRFGSSSLNIDWRALGIAKPRDPYPADVDNANRSCDTDFLEQVGFYLRDWITNAEDGDDDLVNVAMASVTTLDRLARDIDPLAFQASIRDMHGRPTLHMANAKTSPFRAAFLVQAFMLADLLRNSNDYKELLLRVVEVLVPPTLKKVFTSFVNDCSRIVPNKSTLSRWRMLIDCAHMLIQRRLLERLNMDGHCLQLISKRP